MRFSYEGPGSSSPVFSLVPRGLGRDLAIRGCQPDFEVDGTGLECLNIRCPGSMSYHPLYQEYSMSYHPLYQEYVGRTTSAAIAAPMIFFLLRGASGSVAERMRVVWTIVHSPWFS